VPAGVTGVTAIAAGLYHTVALKSDGTVVAWGDNAYGQTNVPAGVTDVRAVAAGGFHTVALKNDGTVVAWGDNAYGQTNVPAGLTGVTAIAAGYFHTVALKSGGTVVAWGDNTHGQTNVPAGLTNVTAIAAGVYHTVALKSDGTVVAWGDNYYGQTNVPAGLTNVTAIAAGYFHTVALVTPQDTTAPTFGACPAAGPFLLNSGAQTVGPIAASDEPGGSGLDTSASTLTGSVDTSTVGTKSVIHRGGSGPQSGNHHLHLSGDLRLGGLLPAGGQPADVQLGQGGQRGSGDVQLRRQPELEHLRGGLPQIAADCVQHQRAGSPDRADRDGGIEQPELRRNQRAVHLRVENRQNLGRAVPPADPAPDRRHRSRRQLPVQVSSGS
jgi:hypothetical protein